MFSQDALSSIRMSKQWRLYRRSQYRQSTLLTLFSHQLRTSSQFIPLRFEISYHVMLDSLNWFQEKTGVSHVQLSHTDYVAQATDQDS